MAVELGGVAIAIGQVAASAVLLVGPQNDPDGAARPEPQPLHEPDGVPGGQCPAAVVHRPLAHVPRVDVPADHDDLVGALGTAQLRDDVAGRRVGQLRASMARGARPRSRPGPANRCSISASSTPSAAAGMRATVESYRVTPVWGLWIENDATDRIRQALAPTRAAADGPMHAIPDRLPVGR